MGTESGLHSVFPLFFTITTEVHISFVHKVLAQNCTKQNFFLCVWIQQKWDRTKTMHIIQMSQTVSQLGGMTQLPNVSSVFKWLILSELAIFKGPDSQLQLCQHFRRALMASSGEKGGEEAAWLWKTQTSCWSEKLSQFLCHINWSGCLMTIVRLKQINLFALNGSVVTSVLFP